MSGKTYNEIQKEIQKAVINAVLNPKADINEKYPLASDAWLDITEEDLKQASQDEMQMLAAVYETKIDFVSKQVQGLIDYVAQVITKSTAVMSKLDMAKIAQAVNNYNKAYPAKKEVESPKLTV